MTTETKRAFSARVGKCARERDGGPCLDEWRNYISMSRGERSTNRNQSSSKSHVHVLASVVEPAPLLLLLLIIAGVTRDVFACVVLAPLVFI